MLLEFNELHQISNGLVTLEISHLHIVVIQLIHYAPVLTISNAYYDYAQRQLPTFHQKVLDFLLVVDDPIGQNQQNHVLLHLGLHVFAHPHSLTQQRSEVCRTRKLKERQAFTIALFDSG
jgi:hypothetical protein